MKEVRIWKIKSRSLNELLEEILSSDRFEITVCTCSGKNTDVKVISGRNYKTTRKSKVCQSIGRGDL